MRAPSCQLSLVPLLLLVTSATPAVTIDWVTVGDPGNPGPSFGSVSTVYRIAKFEITNAQYTEFLNAVAATDPFGLYNPEMATGRGGIARSGSSGSYTYATIGQRGNLPVNWVSFYDAAGFANWLHNGQPTGTQSASTTLDGAYTLSQSEPTRNPEAIVFLPSENEWYKAAYFDASSASYHEYPFADGLDTVVPEAPPGATSHSANCNGAVGDLSEVGAYTSSPSPYGTFDQGGNVSEWNETIRPLPSERGVRGGNFSNFCGHVFDRDFANGLYEAEDLGFRVASVPEPGTGVLLVVGLVELCRSRRRRSSRAEIL